MTEPNAVNGRLVEDDLRTLIGSASTARQIHLITFVDNFSCALAQTLMWNDTDQPLPSPSVA